MKGDAKIRFQNEFGENPSKWKFVQMNKTFHPRLGIEEIILHAKTHVKPVVAAAAAKPPTKPATTKPLATKPAAAKHLQDPLPQNHLPNEQRLPPLLCQKSCLKRPKMRKKKKKKTLLQQQR